MISVSKAKRASIVALFIAGLAAPFAAGLDVAVASEIRYVVNNQPVTSYDIQRRAAFLKLQRKSGNLNQMATDEMIEQALRAGEIKRLNISVSEQQVDDAYARFASSNNMSAQQLDQVLGQTGVTKAHFREFIRAQMGWSQALSARGRAETATTTAAPLTPEQDAVQRMLQQGGQKPSATEYMLQQVIFVIPNAERGRLMGQRKQQAESMRQRFRSCETTRQFATGLIDVTVRDLGRVLEPELPTAWADAVKKLSPGQTTAVRETERGVEFIGVCSAREVSDDRVAELVMGAEEGESSEADGNLSEKYTAELREKARIVER